MLRRAFSRSWSVVLLYLREDRVCLGSNIVSAYKQTNWGLCCLSLLISYGQVNSN